MIEITEQDIEKFKSFTDAYNSLVKTQFYLDELCSKVEEDFPDEQTYNNPLEYTINIVDVIKKSKTTFTSFLVKEFNEKINSSNITIEEKNIQEYVEERSFDHIDVIKHIEETYLNNPDEVALRQIKEEINRLLPWGHYGENNKWGAPYKPEHIQRINNGAGIELKAPWRYGSIVKEPISSLVKLVNITLNHVKPSQAVGFDAVEGMTYRDDNIKSLRYFKNHSLKIVFRSKEDADKVLNAIFLPLPEA